ncbi:hypothetical protein JOB18_001098 [Solea senegalensis]|uniref:Uncharacterized protein n=1 Tax=Solea senegalensis TaxID=28829 RepID=A0AAV6QM39_SOLSE|nr:hypothetical protein JOB18_001098 [Solea senegalensis]
MLARPPRERRTKEGGEEQSRDATAPRVHRRSYGQRGFLHHRTIASRAKDTPVGLLLAEEEKVEGRGGGSYSETTVRIYREPPSQQLSPRLTFRRCSANVLS